MTITRRSRRRRSRESNATTPDASQGFSHARGKALAEIENTGGMAFEAEVCRVKAELLLANGASNAMQAEQLFRKAIRTCAPSESKGLGTSSD